MKNFLKSVFLFSLIFIASCEDNGMIVNCQECEKEEPLNAEVEIKIDIDYYGASAEITIYEGNIEDGIILRTLQASGTNTTTTLGVNKKYTFTAAYYVPPNHYLTVDSATPRVSYNKDQCDDPCYYVYDKVVNLRLKYTK
ncbi:MAG: hypothetical protein IPJ16_12215 [Bacteroidales bacterium]|nr:hypothetical protein [Bacteroidales bacterium]